MENETLAIIQIVATLVAAIIGGFVGGKMALTAAKQASEDQKALNISNRELDARVARRPTEIQLADLLSQLNALYGTILQYEVMPGDRGRLVAARDDSYQARLATLGWDCIDLANQIPDSKWFRDVFEVLQGTKYRSAAERSDAIRRIINEINTEHRRRLEDVERALPLTEDGRPVSVTQMPITLFTFEPFREQSD